MAFWGNIYRQRRKKRYRITGTRGTDHPPFSNFLFTNLFSIKFLYFFIISSLFPYFNLFVSIFLQSYVNIKLHVSTLFLYPAGTPGYRNGTESFFGLKGRPSVVRSCNNVAPVTNLCLGRAATRSHSSQWSKKKVAVET